MFYVRGSHRRSRCSPARRACWRSRRAVTTTAAAPSAPCRSSRRATRSRSRPTTTTVPTSAVADADGPVGGRADLHRAVEQRRAVQHRPASSTSRSTSCATTTAGTPRTAGSRARAARCASRRAPSSSTPTPRRRPRRRATGDTTDSSGSTPADGSPAAIAATRRTRSQSGDAPLVITRKFDITIEQLNAANAEHPELAEPLHRPRRSSCRRPPTAPAPSPRPPPPADPRRRASPLPASTPLR